MPRDTDSPTDEEEVVQPKDRTLYYYYNDS